MIVEYTLEIRAVCPVDKQPDVYTCVVRASRTIPVEDILAAVAAVTRDGPLFQEDLTARLQRLLACEVETFGCHSGVDTHVTCKG